MNQAQTNQTLLEQNEETKHWARMRPYDLVGSTLLFVPTRAYLTENLTDTTYSSRHISYRETK